jgi:BirA family biotin operon repressor/biotin-[acetyl-CoA-carboxylase] ligase
VEGKKVSGILVDLNWIGPKLEYAVIGIGINVLPGSVPKDLEVLFPAACIQDFVDEEVIRIDLLIQVLKDLITWYPKLPTDDFILTWQNRLAFMNHKVILASGDKSLVKGKVQGLTPEGHLILEKNDGDRQNYPSGEISLRPVDRS